VRLKTTKDGQQLLGLRSYAAHRKKHGLTGCSLSTIQQAIAEGKIARTCDDHDRCPPDCSTGGIDKVRADADWRAYDLADNKGKKSGETFAEARTTHETYKARIARLEYEERAGNLVSVADVRAEMFRTARQLRNRLLQIPHTIAPLCVGKDRREIEAVLETEIIHALTELSSWQSKQSTG
jgi:hypothetical protein